MSHAALRFTVKNPGEPLVLYRVEREGISIVADVDNYTLDRFVQHRWVRELGPVGLDTLWAMLARIEAGVVESLGRIELSHHTGDVLAYSQWIAKVNAAVSGRFVPVSHEARAWLGVSE